MEYAVNLLDNLLFIYYLYLGGCTLYFWAKMQKTADPFERLGLFQIWMSYISFGLIDIF